MNADKLFKKPIKSYIVIISLHMDCLSAGNQRRLKRGDVVTPEIKKLIPIKVERGSGDISTISSYAWRRESSVKQLLAAE